MKRSAKFSALLAVGCLAVLTLAGCSKLKARDQLNKGVEAYKSAKYEQAIDHFQNAERLDPTLKTADLYLAAAYSSQVVPGATNSQNIKTGQLAIDSYQKVLARDPNDLTALEGIAAVYLNIGKTVEAKQWQQKVLAVNPSDPVAYYTIGVIDWRDAYKNAITARASIGMHDDGKMITDKKVCASLKDQNTDLVTSGIASLKKAIELRPSYDDAMSYLSLMYRRKADLDCGTRDAKAEHAADMALFNQWSAKTMATRKANQIKKNEQQPKGVILDGQ